MRLPITKEAWFTPWGMFPVPISWQGWMVIAVYLVAIVADGLLWPSSIFGWVIGALLVITYVLTCDR